MPAETVQSRTLSDIYPALALLEDVIPENNKDFIFTSGRLGFQLTSRGANGGTNITVGIFKHGRLQEVYDVSPSGVNIACSGILETKKGVKTAIAKVPLNPISRLVKTSEQQANLKRMQAKRVASFVLKHYTSYQKHNS